jgi:GNAT superfamily N-acetyltransferase
MKSQLPLRFEYTEDIELPNRGFQVDKMSAFLDDAEVGYLKVEYVSLKRFQHFVPTVFHYLNSFSGWHLKCQPGVKPDLSDETFWFNIAMYSRCVSWHEANGPAPPLERRLMHIKEVAKSRQREYRLFKHWHVDKPKVAYIRVADAMRRRGIGTDLYVATAKQLATMGYPLYASTLQQEEAKRVWEYMRETGLPIQQERTRDKKNPLRYVLSFQS